MVGNLSKHPQILSFRDGHLMSYTVIYIFIYIYISYIKPCPYLLGDDDPHESWFWGWVETVKQPRWLVSYIVPRKWSPKHFLGPIQISILLDFKTVQRSKTQWYHLLIDHTEFHATQVLPKKLKCQRSKTTRGREKEVIVFFTVIQIQGST